MLEPDDFDTSDAPPPFAISASSLRIGARECGAVQIPAYYDAQLRLRLRLDSFFTEHDVLDPNISCFAKFGVSSEEHELITTQRTIAYGAAIGIRADAIPRIEPITITQVEKGTCFKAVLRSPPLFLSRPIRLQSKQVQKFELRPPNSKDCPYWFILGEYDLPAKDALDSLKVLLNFLTFVKGSHCGFGNLVAYDSNMSVAFSLIGFTRNDDGERKTNWFDREVQDSLPIVFDHFSDAVDDAKTNRALRQSIGFYRASTASRDVSLEMAIIASHSALEAIVNYTLEYRAGWSSALLGERSITFSDKMRVAAAHFGLEGNVLEHSPELMSLASARQIADAFAMISFIRNKLVHQDPKFSPTGIQLHETWCVAQWLIEVLVFGVIGYRGIMIDRRVYTGWRGTTISVPLLG